MATAQVFSSPPSGTAVRRNKRSLAECAPATSSFPHSSTDIITHDPIADPTTTTTTLFHAKRRCRHDTLDALLRSDHNGFDRYPARRAALADRAIPDLAVLQLLQGLGGDPLVLLRIVDLNVFAPRITALLADYAARGAPLAALNVRAHSFSLAQKDTVLANFARAFPPDAHTNHPFIHTPAPCQHASHQWLNDIVAFVARVFFQQDTHISIAVLSGGGVRDVLIADWCAMYRITPAQQPPHLVILSTPSGRNFLLPFQPLPTVLPTNEPRAMAP